jgi:hypothetical protein
VGGILVSREPLYTLAFVGVVTLGCVLLARGSRR